MLGFLKRTWRDISKGKNVEIYLILLATLGILVADLFSINIDSIFQNVVLALFSILLFGLLESRHSDERIEGKIDNLNTGTSIKARKELQPIHQLGKDATEIALVGIAISQIPSNHYFLEQKIQEGAKLRFLLLNPDSPAIDLWDTTVPIKSTKVDIQRTLMSLESLKQLAKANKGSCEVRLANMFPHFSMAAFDFYKESGFLVLENHAYKTELMQRPNIILTQMSEKRWFEFYRQQFEIMWKEAAEWESPK